MGRTRQRAGLAGLVLALSALSIAATARAETLRGRAGPNVLYVLIDTLRADHLGSWGYTRDTSPTIDHLARLGVQFTRVRSQASWTKPSMAATWTAVHPSGTGVLRFSHALPEAARLPAEIFREAGWRTAGLWRNGWVAPNFGFGRGFDLYVRPPAGQQVTQRFGGSGARRLPTDLDLTQSALSFLSTFRDQRFLLYVHYMDVHQYVYDDRSALFGTGYADAYDNAIHWVDSNVAMLLNGLDALGLLDRTLVVIAADHGEEFGDHRSEGHGRTLYEEVTHVPLVMSQPGRLPLDVTVVERVQNIDLWPTVLELVGLPGLPDVDGRSLVPLIERTAAGGPATAGDEAKPTFSHIDRVWGRSEEAPRPLVSVTVDDWRLIHPLTPPGRDQLFDLTDDPREQRDHAAEQPERVAALRARIEALTSRPPRWGTAREIELDALHVEQLRALGYLGLERDEGDEAEPVPQSSEAAPSAGGRSR